MQPTSHFSLVTAVVFAAAVSLSALALVVGADRRGDVPVVWGAVGDPPTPPPKLARVPDETEELSGPTEDSPPSAEPDPAEIPVMEEDCGASMRLDRSTHLVDLDAVDGWDRSTRLVPNYLYGRPNGTRLQGIPEGSCLADLGLISGDVVARVDGLFVANPESLAEVMRSLESGAIIEVTLERRGRPMSLVYHLE